jgi:hypothetical protein
MNIGGRGLLDVSVENLISGRPFSVYKCFGELTRFLIYKDDEETNASENLLLFGDEICSDDSRAFKDRVLFSTWVLTAYQWKLNLRFLQDAFSDRRHNAIAQPGMYTYLPMIRLRRLIVGMRDEFPRARAQVGIVDRCFECLQPKLSALSPSTLNETLAEVFEKVNVLDRELNDEIHLIIGAVTVQDSDANKQQTERATLLTLLAAVYLPLTLVTGIFGMNIKEIDQSKTSWRTSGEVLAVVAACTIVFVVAYRFWRRWRRRHQEREQMQHYKSV